MVAVWLRGPVPGYPPLLMPAVHALLQVREEIERLSTRVTDEQAWIRPGGAAAVGFHVQHIAGSLDRLFTYARGEMLDERQRADLAAEDTIHAAGPAFADVVANALARIDRALAQLAATDPATLLEPRKVGRASLPSNVLGLLFHGAEHATRHTGQAVTTARTLTGSGL